MVGHQLRNLEEVLFSAWQHLGKDDRPILGKHAARALYDGVFMALDVDLHDRDRLIE